MKRQRREAIQNLITKHRISTQEELVEMLNADGFKVTQATVSRDIREMKITKVADERGISYYALSDKREANLNDKYMLILNNGVRNYDYAGNFLVIRTITGTAMAVATAIDELSWPEVVGCIAGDDTVFVATADEEMAHRLGERLDNWHLGE